MRKLKTLGATIAILSLTLFPAAGALFQLGAGLTALDRMHARGRTRGANGIETIGSYEVDPVTMQAGLRLHEMKVVHGR